MIYTSKVAHVSKFSFDITNIYRAAAASSFSCVFGLSSFNKKIIFYLIVKFKKKKVLNKFIYVSTIYIYLCQLYTLTLLFVTSFILNLFFFSFFFTQKTITYALLCGVMCAYKEQENCKRKSYITKHKQNVNINNVLH